MTETTPSTPATVVATTLTPHIACRNAEEAVEFYQKAFGAVLLMKMNIPGDGRVMHADLSIDGARFYVVDEFPEQGGKSPQALGGSPVMLSLSVADCDAVFAKAIEAGCKVQMPLADMFWGDRWGLLVDPYGHSWSISTPKQRLSEAEIAERMSSIDMSTPAGVPRKAKVRMAKLVFGMNQSLDGYVDVTALPQPSPTLFRHFVEEAQGQVGSLYGRKVYEMMRYWEQDHPEWGEDQHAFAAAWRRHIKWVVSRSLESVGPNARLIQGDLESAIRGLKTEHDGEIEVAGPELAHSLTELGLIDEYRMYLHPVVIGHGKPYFAGLRPPLRFKACDRIDDGVLKLTYVPA